MRIKFQVAVSLPTGVRLEEIAPRSVAVRIEAVEERDIAIRAEIQGEVPAGRELYSQTVTPAKVRVRGPSGFVRTLEYVSTEPIDVTNRLTDFTARQIPITVSDPKASILSETVVDVAFHIGEKRIERTFMVPLTDGSGRRAEVILFGGRSLFEKVRATDLNIQIDKNGAGDDVVRPILPATLDGKVEIKKATLR